MPVSRRDFQILAELRLQDAMILHDAHQYSASYYLAGYAVECALKACISKNFQFETIPDKAFVNKIYTHNPKELLQLSGLLTEQEQKCREDKQFFANWNMVFQWNEQSRYQLWDRFSCAHLIEAISNENHGVLPWLKTHW